MKKEKNVKQILLTVIIVLLFILVENTKNANQAEVNQLTITNTTSNINISVNDIPEYSGQIVIDLNNGVPYFEDKDITTDNFEDYSKLDELKRAGQAFANICKYTMPKERNQKRKYFL